MGSFAFRLARARAAAGSCCCHLPSRKLALPADTMAGRRHLEPDNWAMWIFSASRPHTCCVSGPAGRLASSPGRELAGQRILIITFAAHSTSGHLRPLLTLASSPTGARVPEGCNLQFAIRHRPDNRRVKLVSMAGRRSSIIAQEQMNSSPTAQVAAPSTAGCGRRRWVKPSSAGKTTHKTQAATESAQSSWARAPRSETQTSRRRRQPVGPPPD